MDKKHLWGEAVVEHPSGTNASIFAVPQSDIYSSIYCLLFIIFFLLTFKHIRRSLIPIIRCCFSFSQIMKTQDNLSLEQGRIILFIFSLFHFSMVAFFFIQTFRFDLYSRFGWLIIPLLFLVFVLLYISKWAVFAFIGWVIQCSNELKFIANGLRDFSILASIATFPLSLASLLSWSSLIKPLTFWCVSVVMICYLLFLLRTLRYFIYVRFSIFFWILYLCTLEIAPLALLYSAF